MAQFRRPSSKTWLVIYLVLPMTPWVLAGVIRLITTSGSMSWNTFSGSELAICLSLLALLVNQSLLKSERILDSEEKMEEAAKLEPVITMAGSSGHIVLYLGKAHNGKLYFMHQCGWGYDEDNGQHFIVNRVTVNSAEHKWYDINEPKVFTTMIE